MTLSIRNVASWLLASLLILLGFVRRARKKAMRGDFILSIYFHSPSKREFENSIKWLKKNKFTFLSTDDIYRIIKQKLPIPKGSVILTVDDGWQSNENNIVEVADRHHVPVTIFVSTEPVEQGAYWWSYLQKAKDFNYELPPKARLKKVSNDERIALVNEIKRDIALPREAMTVEQVKRIASSKFITIGGHTDTHPILVNCDYEQAYHELKVSKEKLESWISDEVSCFAYPNGDYSEREIQVLNELGYKFAFSSDPEYITEEKLLNHYTLPRFGLLEGASSAENICRMVGVWKLVMQSFRFPYLIKDDYSTPQPIFSSKRTKVTVSH
jgi:poly-beta-1,6-N-acetyl-D-glucosamine N-deacetylase